MYSTLHPLWTVLTLGDKMFKPLLPAFTMSSKYERGDKLHNWECVMCTMELLCMSVTLPFIDRIHSSFLTELLQNVQFVAPPG